MNCLVIYIGNAYSPDSLSYNGEYRYSVDVRDNFQNHEDMIYRPFMEMGYDIHRTFLTNKHEKYHDFVHEFADIELLYDDITNEDYRAFYDYYFKLKNRRMHGPGTFWSGGRFLKLHGPLPDYDLYVIVRSDAQFKIPINTLNINYEKMNWLWPETDIEYFSIGMEEMREEWGSEFQAWEETSRVNGNVLNVIPKKYINVFQSYYWAEHLAVFLMLKDLSPIITLEDVNLMVGYDRCYATDARFCENPVYTFNKRIIESNLSGQNVSDIDKL